MTSSIPGTGPGAHGGVRGMAFDRRSSQFEGRFGRMFRSLPAATWSEAALKALAGDGNQENRMAAGPEVVEDSSPPRPTAAREDADDNGKPHTSRLHDDEENAGIDAGYTYLGQLIDHDITFDPASSLQGQNDVDALVDFRTPRLDLDCLYGRGPADQPYMYSGDGRKFQLGRPLTEGVGGKIIAYDLPRHSWTEGKNEFHRALIGDKRNDENVIVSQLHSIFLRFHNKIADNNDLDFKDVQRLVRWHYQYVVLHDFLPTIARTDVIDSVLPHLRSGRSIYNLPPVLRFYQPQNNNPFIPVEFSAAAYRFGHSMVRPIYRLNTKLGGTAADKEQHIDGRQFIFAGLKERGLNGFDSFPSIWGIDWNLFFDLTGDKNKARFGKDRTQPTYKIDTSLVNPLAFLPEFSEVKPSTPSTPLTDVSQLQPPPKKGEIASLPLRNLLRGMSMGLPSGQDVAQLMGLTPLSDDLLRVGKATAKSEYVTLPKITDISPEFAHNAPLWYYVLAEAQHDWLLAGGEEATPVRLGEVGSRIVVETLVGLLLSDSHSVLRQAPAWTPKIGKGAKFDMPDFVKYAIT